MKLFEPITIGNMTIGNRILMSSMGLGHGYTNKRVQDFYVARARGGVGAISIGAGEIHRRGIRQGCRRCPGGRL